MKNQKNCINIPAKVARAMSKSLTKGQNFICLLKFDIEAQKLGKRTKWYWFFFKVPIGHLETWVFPLSDKGVAFSVRYDGVLQGRHVIKICDVAFVDSPNKDVMLDKRAHKKNRNRFFAISLAILVAMTALFESIGSTGEALTGLLGAIALIFTD